ncbi:SRSF protein kinase 3-like isoform X2 [Rhopilema esculentum]|uniref:SRSF protein kinase 3-like isoform X2 n=1 Tax=Rhopilema esculentum TaxID=499914 RepID=UPI0031D72AF3
MDIKGQQRKVKVIQAKKRRTKPPASKVQAKVKDDSTRKPQRNSISQMTEDGGDEDYRYESSDLSEDDYEESEEEQEDPSDYCKGGYHVVKIGDLFNDRYHVIRKLGWGHFSTVWLSWDLKMKSFVALKIVKSASHYTETAVDEMKLLQTVHTADPKDPGYPHVVQLLDNFKISGIHGTHICMVFEVLGHNLLRMIIKSNYKGIPLPLVKTIIKQTLEGLNYLHTKCKIIHTDVKPENILVCITQDDIQKLASEAASASAAGKVSRSLGGTAPVHVAEKQMANGKMSRNRKKKLKKKIKKQLEKHNNGTNSNTTEKDETNEEPLEEKENEEISKSKGSGKSMDEGYDINFQNQRQGVNKNEKGCGNLSCNEDVTMKSFEKENEVNKDKKDRCEDKDKPSSDEQNNEILDHVYNSFNGDVEKQIADTLKLDDDDEMETTEKGPKYACEVSGTLNENIKVKIADLGNACWIHHHFTEEIQTRQYRSIEVLIGSGYGPPADIWSTACMAFELATGDFLFEPHSGEDYSRDEDHIALIMELLGRLPKHISLSGKYSRDYFTRKGDLKHIKKLRPWCLRDVLIDKYEWPVKDAEQFSSFIEPMLDYVPEKRATAAQCLNHEFLLT